MSDKPQAYHLVGIGGSGMLPLASILVERGHTVSGSDRGRDQGRSPEKFAWLERVGIRLFPQDGSGVSSPKQIVVASAAIEASVPDIGAAERRGARRVTRPELLSEMFNAGAPAIGIAGTSGKSTVTGMLGWILHATGRAPTVMNGAVMKNFATPDAPFASALAGTGDAFVSEVDESDGSIAMYDPAIAVVTNITLDHKPLDELRPLFARFIARARVAIVNGDDPEAAALAASGHALTYALDAADADLRAHDLVETPGGVTFSIDGTPVRLAVPGRHNASNALAALAAAREAGVPLPEAADALAGFQGLKRRLETVGEANGVTVIDDFAHNPDKVAATLRALRVHPGRLLLFFQPHGYGPLKVMGTELAATFAREMGGEDRLIVCDPVYMGGTVDRSVGSAQFVAAVGDGAEHVPARANAGERLAKLAASGDRIVIMGARDDTLSAFAEGLVARLA